MEIVNEAQSFFETPGEVRSVHGTEESESRKRPSVRGWIRILLVHYQWPLFEAVRYALWLSR
jgi:hypothetical protein